MSAKHLKVALITTSLALNLAVIAFIGYLHFMQPGSQLSFAGLTIRRDKLFFEALSLDVAQLRTLERQTAAFRMEINKKRNEIVQKKRRLVSLLRDEVPNASAIESTIFEIGMKEDEIWRMVILHFLEHKSVLEKEQQQRYIDLIETALLQGGRFGCPLADSTKAD